MLFSPFRSLFPDLSSPPPVNVLNKLLRDLLAVDSTGTGVTHEYLQFLVFTLLTIGITTGIMIKVIGRRGLGTFLREEIAVPARRIARTAKEIERKTFHASGLSVPLIYQILLIRGWNQEEVATLGWLLVLCIWTGDLGRLYVPFIRDHWPMAHILREHEQDQLTGVCWFSAGCALTVNLFSPSVACASICYLVVGDLCAALFGIAFGGEMCVVKLGRAGKKSVEGSVAMFIACIVVGLFLFAEEPLAEYPVVLGAVVATIVELMEPFAVNDNLSIPVFTGLALHLGFLRMGAYCEMMGSSK